MKTKTSYPKVLADLMKNIAPTDLDIGGGLSTIVSATGASYSDLMNCKDHLARTLGSIAWYSPDYCDAKSDMAYLANILARKTRCSKSTLDTALNLVFGNVTPVKSGMDKSTNIYTLGGSLASIVDSSLVRAPALLTPKDGIAPIDHAVCALSCAYNGDIKSAIADLATFYSTLRG